MASFSSNKQVKSDRSTASIHNEYNEQDSMPSKQVESRNLPNATPAVSESNMPRQTFCIVLTNNSRILQSAQTVMKRVMRKNLNICVSINDIIYF